MGANEISNRVEASAWIAAAGEVDGDGLGTGLVVDTDFFFRSLSGFVNKIEVLGLQPGDTWENVLQLTVALFLDRNYARKDTTMLLQPINSFRPEIGDPANILPLVFGGPLQVTPLSAAGYQSVKDGGATPFTLPASADPYSVLLVLADLEQFQEFGKGLEFGIEVLRMQDNDAPDQTETTLVPPLP